MTEPGLIAVPAAVPVVDWAGTRGTPLEEIAARHLDAGAGFVVVSGLPVAPSTDAVEVAEMVRHALPGLCLLPQGPADVPVHLVRGPGEGPRGPADEGFPATDRYMEFHTDGAYLDESMTPDCVALACLSPGERGGTSLLLTASALLDGVKRADPTCVDRLFQPFPFAALEAAAPSEAPAVTWHPILRIGPDGVTARVHRFRIYSALDVQHDPPDADARRALRAIGKAFHRPAAAFRFRLRPGDLLLLDNRRVLHGRDEFSDRGADHQRRRIVRIWFQRTASFGSARQAG